MNKLHLLSAVVALITLSSACKPTQPHVNNTMPTKTETTNQIDQTLLNMIFNNWIVYEVAGTKVEGSDQPYVEFGKDTTNPSIVKCYAYDGCNYINGDYTITTSGNIKRNSDFISTMRMCEDAPYQTGIINALNNVAHFRIEKSSNIYMMYLLDNTNQKLMTLRLQNSFINGAWNVTNVDGQKIEPDTDLKLIIDLNQKSVHGNAGCNVLNGIVVLNSNNQDAISFTKVATTRMTCPDIDIERIFLNALSKVQSMSHDNNIVLLKDINGATLITLHRSSTK